MTTSHMPEGAGPVALEVEDSRWQAGISAVQGVTDHATARDRGAGWKAIYKQAATLQAQAALAGVRVDPVEDDHGTLIWIVSKWSLTRQCETLGEVRELLARMGVAL